MATPIKKPTKRFIPRNIETYYQHDYLQTVCDIRFFIVPVDVVITIETIAGSFDFDSISVLPSIEGPGTVQHIFAQKVRVAVPDEYFGYQFNVGKVMQHIVDSVSECFDDPEDIDFSDLTSSLNKNFLTQKTAPASYPMYKTKYDPAVKTASDFENMVSLLSLELPGINETVDCPVSRCLRIDGTPYRNGLRSTVIHVNDSHKWSLVQIADWLDKLYDDGVVDLAFRSNDG